MLGPLLGRGGMGVVYQAQHVHLGRTVALKLLAPELSNNEDFRARFLREARLAAELDHPGIVTVYDAGDVDGVLFLAMRFVRGTDLAALLVQRGPLDATETLSIIEQVAAALDAAHAAGLVHRDVKPANVMIEGQRCYLTDFGLTKSASSDSIQLTAAGQFLGTVDYVAPEQIESRDVDGRADVYALGCVLFECLTGSRPYPRDSQVAVIYAQLREPPPRACDIRKDLPGAVDAVIAEAMAKKPADRYPTCEALVTAARAALAAPAAATAEVQAPLPTPARTDPRPEPPTSPSPDLPTSPVPAAERLPTAPLPASLVSAQAPPPSAPAPAPPPRRRSPVPFVAAGLGVAAIAIAAVVLASGGGDKGTESTATSTPTAATPAPQSSGNGPEVRAPIEVGTDPVGIVVRAPFVYVANSTRNTVTKLSMESGERKTIPVGTAPFDMASNNHSVWSANSGSNSVSRIPLDSGKAGPELPVGKQPLYLTAANDFAYVSNSGDDTVTVLDANTGRQVGKPIKVGDDPRGITTSPGAVWVADAGDGSVTEIVDGRVKDTVRTGDGAANVAFGNDAVWVSNEDAGTVSRVDVDSLRVTSAQVGSEPQEIAVGDDSVWVAVGGDDKGAQLDADT